MWFLAIPGLIRAGISVVPPFIWKCIAVIAIGLGLYFYGVHKGGLAERVKCEEKAAIAQTAANNQDLQAEKDAHANDLEVTNNLKLQKQVDDVAIEKLKADLAKRPAGSKCVYDKSNADPDDPAAGGVRDDRQIAVPRTGNKKSPRPAILPAARPSSASPRGE